MEEMIEKSSLKENDRKETTQELPSDTTNKVKPRALIFKARDKELYKIKKIIETQFPEVKILYITTGHPSSILRVTKSTPLENQNSSTQPLYTIE